VGAGDAVDRVEREVRPERAGVRRGARALLADAHLQVVGERGRAQQAGGAQPRQQVVGRPVQERAGEQCEQPAAERGVARGHAALEGVGDAVGLEDAFEQRPARLRAPQDHGDLPRQDPRAQEAGHVDADELALGPLAAAGQEHDGVPGIRPRPGLGLEQRALQVVQRARGVVRGHRGELRALGAEREQLLVGGRAARERLASRLEGQGDRDGSAGLDGQRLHDVQLDRGEVVEAVHEHRGAAPAARLASQDVRGGDGPRRLVRATDRRKSRAIAAMQRGEVLRVVRAGRLGGGPRAQGHLPARRVDAQRGQLVLQPGERRGEAGGGRGVPEHAQAGARRRQRRDALAGERPERPAVDPGPAGELVEQPVPREDPGAEDDAAPASSRR
jgi:hypothetical protein